MKPRIPIHDPNFKYTPSTHTDIRQTFARIRREAKRAEAAESPEPSPPIDISTARKRT